MALFRTENFKIELLAELTFSSERELREALNSAEQKFVDEYECVTKGWNAVSPPRSSRVLSRSQNLSALARENGVHPSSLSHRVKNLGEEPEEAIRYLNALPPAKIYIYGRQEYHSIKQLAEDRRINKYGVDRKTIEVRIRKCVKHSEEIFEERNGRRLIQVPDKVFAKTRKRHSIQLRLDDGDLLEGTIRDVYEQGFERGLTDLKYSAIPQRLDKG